MAVIIRWVEQQKIAEGCINVFTSIGCLVIYHIDNVITRTEWDLDIPVNIPIVDHGLARKIQNHLEKPTDSLTFNLQKQGSDFRNKVWADICKISVGQVLSYTQLARNIGSGSRAVANACRDNPFPGIIPCHRVVSVSGLGGYMGKTSGRFFEIKKKLLALESQVQFVGRTSVRSYSQE